MIKLTGLVDIGPLCIKVGKLTSEGGVAILSDFLQSGGLDLANNAHFVTSGNQALGMDRQAMHGDAGCSETV